MVPHFGKLIKSPRHSNVFEISPGGLINYVTEQLSYHTKLKSLLAGTTKSGFFAIG